jgi:hypothetical protein
MEALMFGSLMMFASGVLASAPSSASASSMRWSSGRRSANWAMMRPESEMSRVSTATPAVEAYASMTGRNEYVASKGASSVCV